MQNVQSRSQRIVLFVGLIIIALLIIVGMVVGAIVLTLNTSPRNQANTVSNEFTIAEIAILPDDDSYPATVVVNSVGTVFTGSYATGALWSMEPQSMSATTTIVQEIPDTREQIGAIAGLAGGADNTLYILDRMNSQNPQGAIIWTYTPEASLQQIANLEVQTIQGVADIAVDATGQIYLSDRIGNRILRGSTDEAFETWWQPLDTEIQHEITGLAYDAFHQALLITDPTTNRIYRVPVASENPEFETEILYQHEDSTKQPNFNGIAVTPGGEIFVAALGQNQVMQFDEETGTLLVIAENFRGASDVAYDVTRNQLFVANWDQIGLLGAGIQPRLPFALDAIQLPE